MAVPYLLVEHLTKSVGDKTLFSDISFAVNEGQRVALIARNGIGKSTLLDILTGKTDYDSGKITFRNDLKIGYLPQQLPSAPDTAPVDGLRYTQLLTQLGVSRTDDFAHLSGGQQKRIALAHVLAAEPDLLFLDEPTNHLDLDMVIWLEEYLRKARITLLLVTHDRYFLDRVCFDIIELDQHSLYTYHGDYADYLEKRAERLEIQQAETDKYRNFYRTELDWMRRMPQARAHKAQYRIDNFYEIERKAKQTIRETDIRLEVRSAYIGNKIFEAHDVSKRFGDIAILNHFSYVFSRYEKLGIIGNNGTGKSTFLKLLLGEIAPDSGHFDIGTTVRFGYYQQCGLTFDEGKKVIDIVRDIAETIDLGNGDRLTASQFLQHFLFSPAQQYDFVGKLSGGERQRLHLCTVLMRNPNFLILDEPTNDLDIPTLQVLEEYLCAFKGCLIVVSHDRYFMDRVVDHLFVFHGNAVVKDFPGNYTQWREATKALEEQTKEQKAPSAPASNTKVRTETKRHLSFKEKQELADLETRMPALEQEKADLEALLSGGTADPAAIAAASARYEQVQQALDEVELRWLELSEY
ncbi:MAG: ABC-F family ATP-binding cassette domain-containing protein [Paludibacteraceae bacterium]